MDFKTILLWAQQEENDVIRLRREFHQIPERAFMETQTAALIRNTLESLQIPYETVGTGTVADIKNAAGDAPRLALRADIDALPIEEKTGLPYASVHQGLMHACGHDAHTAMLLEAVKIVWRNRASLPASVRFIFQPAEEAGGGAVKMIEAGALDGIREIYCLHVRAQLPAGNLCTRPGYIHAASDGYKIRLIGKGCHGAAPQNGVDAIVISAHTVLALQEIISREMGAWDQAVLTIGKIAGGTARNIVCDEVIMDGTLRTLNEELRERLKKRITEVCQGAAAMLRGQAEVTFSQGYCSCYNDETTTQKAIDVAEKLFPDVKVAILPLASMGSEDFGFYQKVVPGTKFYIGTGCPQEIHTPCFVLDEAMLARGTAFFCALAFGLNMA